MPAAKAGPAPRKKAAKRVPKRMPREKLPPTATLIRAYMRRLPPESRRALQQIRAAIRSVAPGATDFFSYRIPALRFEGEPLVWYAAWRSHTSLYPIGEDITKKHAAATRRYKTAKGTIQFPLSEPPPVDLIKRLIQARIAQIRAKARAL